jgi:hypothetical protein
MTKTPDLPDDLGRLARRLATEPVLAFTCELPQPPGINDWWEPVTIRRGSHTVASMKLTRKAVKYKSFAEDQLLRLGIDVVALEDAFRDLWLHLHVTSYLSTPMERDVDGPLKPLQDFMCQLLGVNDARVRHASGSVLLDASRPRVKVCVQGFQVWNSSGGNGPFYTIKTSNTPQGRRSVAQQVTPRRILRPIAPGRKVIGCAGSDYLTAVGDD